MINHQEVLFSIKQNNIEFEYQVSFNGCRNKKLLLFDFKIYTTSGFFLLELDGEQHYVAMANWGGEEGLRRMQKNDRIKEEYCKKNNIKLIRVPYWEFDNIEEILKRILESEGGYKIA